MNFGAIGSVIGHEITHEFDDFALNSAKWSETSRKLYEDKVNCLVDHVSSYHVQEIEDYFHLDEKFYLNGQLTKKEDIADLGGVKLSFNAYRNYAKKQQFKESQDQVLIGFEEFSPEQLFFLSFAQFHCTIERPAKAKVTAETDEHTLSRYRVLATLSNVPEFAEVWKCPVNSTMNPLKKCSVW